MGLREGLQLSHERGINRLIVELDSKAIADMMLGDSDGGEGRPTLMSDCRYLASKFAGIRFMHVFREGNKCADTLVNLAQGSDWGMSILVDTPDVLANLLLADAGGASFRRIR